MYFLAGKTGSLSLAGLQPGAYMAARRLTVSSWITG
jgi:hypothetical protein